MSDMNPSPEFEEKVRKALETPGANLEFVNRLRNELARRPANVKPRFVLKPAWVIAFGLVLIALIASAPAAVSALKKLFGYVPGVGLVDNSAGMRVLAEPASVTREGVTLTVSQALVYPDHVQLIYQVSGIAPENDGLVAADAASDYAAFCNPPDGDAKLRLPDGTVIERAFGTDKYPENVFALKPAYEVSIPADVTELTMVLKCLPWARLGAVPENWEVMLKLKYAPAGTVIGEPVLDVTPSVSSSVHDKDITVTLDKVVPQDDLYSFYFRVQPDEKNDAVLAYFPAWAYMIDATGQKVALVYNSPFPGMQDTAEPWELQSIAKPAYGPYRLVIDKIFKYYQEDGADFFEFDMGPEPQVGQTWAIGQTLHLAGTDVRIVSATMVEKDLAAWGLSEHTQGIQFNFEAVDGATPFLVDVMDRDLDRIMSGNIIPFSENGEPSTEIAKVLFYGNGAPSGKVQFAINGQTVMTTGNWELEWASPDQTGVDLLDPASMITSGPGASGVAAELKRVVNLDDGYLFFIHMTAPEQQSDFKSINPQEVFVVDASGQKIKLTLDGPQTYIANAQSVWQFSTKENIVPGPIQLIVENVKLYYSNFNFDTPPAPEALSQIFSEHSFIFDVGADPQVGQAWTLNQEFEIGGYKGIVTSVRAVTVDPQLLPFPGLRTDVTINRGYEFTIQSMDPAIQWNVNMSLSKPRGVPGNVDCIGGLDGEVRATTTYTVSCRGLFDNRLEATINEISVWVDGAWEVDWDLPSQ